MSNQNDDGRVVEPFDYELGQLHGLPGVTSTRQATVRNVTLIESTTWIVQTFRQRDVTDDDPKPARDTIFLEYIGKGGKSLRLVIPSSVADTIARQRDKLTAISRRRGAQKAVQTRADRGIVSAFKKKGAK